MALETNSYTLEELEKKYSKFFSPMFEILIDGVEVVKQKQMLVPSLTVETSVEPEANAVVFTVANAYDHVSRDLKWLGDLFVLGKTLEVKMGYKDKLKLMFYGIIASVTVDYPEDNLPSITVKGLDMSTLMMKGTKSRSWNDKKYSDVVKEVASSYVPQLKVDDTGEKISTIVQSQMSDFKFLEFIAFTCNYDLFLADKTLYFRKPMTATSKVLTLSYGQYLHSFHAEMSLAEQLTRVTVRGWDDKKQEAIIASSSTINKLGSNAKTGKDLLSTHGEFEEHVYTNVDSANEASTKAEALMNRRAMKLIVGEGQAVGIPELKAGRYVMLDGLGKQLDQPFYVTASTHKLDGSGYTTSFQVQGNAV